MSLSQNNSASSLSLSDIIHTSNMSSPAVSAQSSQVIEPAATSTSFDSSGGPEPLQEEEMERYRVRVEEMGLKTGSSYIMSPREKELSDMILRLVGAPRPDLSQLEQQATLINQLTAQRDLLTHYLAEERARRESERDGWERATEALIVQHQKNEKNIYYSQTDELEHKCLALEQDNKELQNKEKNVQDRLAALESELYRLKPVLLLHPQPSHSTLQANTAVLSSLPYPSATGAVALKESRDKIKLVKKRKKEKAKAEELAATEASSSQQPVAGPSSASNKPQTRSSLYHDTQKSPAPSIYHHLLRKSSEQAGSSKTQKGKRARSPKRSSTLSSDARSEHLILAARKIGRERAALVSGLITAKAEREQEKHRQAREAMEREKQTAGVSGYYRQTGKKGKGTVALQAPSTSAPRPVHMSQHRPVNTPHPSSSKHKNTTTPRTPPQPQIFHPPGSPYMFVSNPGIVGYSHAQTPPGAVRIPPSQYPNPAQHPLPHPRLLDDTQLTSPARESVQPRRQSRKNQDVATSLAAAINSSMDADPSPSSQSQTAFSSLLSAAEMIDESGEQTNEKGKKRVSGPPDSPNSKRRKINSTTAAGGGGGTVRNLGKKARSALDVLAESAAAEQAQQEIDGPGDGRDESEAESTSMAPSRRSSRPTRGKRKETLANAATPRMISPANTNTSSFASIRESLPRMIAPPGASRSVPTLLPPPVITSTSSVIPPPVESPIPVGITKPVDIPITEGAVPAVVDVEPTGAKEIDKTESDSIKTDTLKTDTGIGQKEDVVMKSPEPVPAVVEPETPTTVTRVETPTTEVEIPEQEVPPTRDEPLQAPPDDLLYPPIPDVDADRDADGDTDFEVEEKTQ